MLSFLLNAQGAQFLKGIASDFAASNVEADTSEITIAAGDLILAVTTSSGDYGIPTDFTSILQQAVNGDGSKMQVSYKTAAGSETAVTISDTGYGGNLVVFVFDGAFTTVTGNSAANDTWASPTVTLAGSTSDLSYGFVILHTEKGTISGDIYVPEGMSCIYDYALATNDRILVAYEVKAAGISSYEPGDFTAAGTDDCAVAAICVEP